MTKLMGYKYTMNPSKSRFTISSFLTLLIYIISESVSLRYHYSFFLCKVTNLSIWESLYLSKETICRYQLLATLAYQTPSTASFQRPELSISSHQTSWLGRMNHIAWTKKLINYPTHQTYSISISDFRTFSIDDVCEKLISHQFLKLVFDISRSFHYTQPRHTWVRMQDESTSYHEHFYPTGPSTTHQSSTTPHSDRIGNPMVKLDLLTPMMFDTLSNTQCPSITTTSHTRHL
jgi:hypothetical protein